MEAWQLREGWAGQNNGRDESQTWRGGAQSREI